MATNGNIVCYPFVRKPTIRKSARGGANLIPNVVEPVRDFYKDISDEPRQFRVWLDSNPHIQSDVTWNQSRTVKTTTYTNVNIVTTDTVSVTAGFEIIID